MKPGILGNQKFLSHRLVWVLNPVVYRLLFALPVMAGEDLLPSLAGEVVLRITLDVEIICV